MHFIIASKLTPPVNNPDTLWKNMCLIFVVYKSGKHFLILHYRPNKKNLMKKALLLLLFAASCIQYATAQFTVTGKVTDKDRVSLTGVTIAEKGTVNGAYSDENGSYTLTVKKVPATLVYSYVGYATQEIVVSGDASLDVIMNDAATELAAKSAAW